MAGAEEAARPVASGAVGRPPGAVRFFYSLGQWVESGYLIANTFVFFYYTAVLGLPGSAVGAAFAIAMCLDAAADPLIGSLSDSLRTKFGRRLPLMLLAAPLVLIAMGMQFAPPPGLSLVLLFAWLTVAKMAVRAFASLYNIPYFALAGELTPDYAERSRIASERLLSGILGTVLVTLLAYSVFFAGEGGLQKPERYPPFGWTVGGLMLLMGLTACAGLWRFASALPQPTAAPEPMGRRLWGEVAEVARNRSFQMLFLTMLLFASAVGVHQSLQNHTYVFVFQLRPEAIRTVTLSYLGGLAAGVPLTGLLLQRLEKKTVALGGFALAIAALSLLPGARALGLVDLTGAAALPWLALTVFVMGIGTGLVFIAVPSMMSDAADEHEHLHGVRREGLFFSGMGFAGKAAAGMGSLIGGAALDLLRFPGDAGRTVNAEVAEDVLRGLTFAWGPACAALWVVCMLLLAPYAIGRVRHAEIATDLAARRAREFSGARSF